MTTAVAEPAPANTETATAEPNDDAEAAATFDKVKATQVNEPEPEETPTPPAKTTPAPKPKAEPEQKPAKGEPAQPAAPEIPEELLTGKPATPKAEPTEVDKALDYEPPASLSEKAKANWGQLREHAKTVAAENAALKAENAATKAQLEQVKAKPAVDEKAYKQKIEQYEQHLSVFAVEKSEAFQKLQSKEQKAIDRARAALKEAGADVTLADAGVKLSLGRRLKLLQENIEDADVRHSVSDDLKEVDRIGDEKADLIANSKTKAAELEQQERAEQERKQRLEKEEDSKAFAEAREEMRKSILPFKRVHGAERWNQQADQLEQMAEEAFSGSITPKDAATNALLAAAAPSLVKLVATLQERLNAATAQLGKLTVAQPTAGEPGATFVASNDASQLTPDQIAEADFNRALAGAGQR